MKEGSTYQYSAADIQRYISGNMSAAEMHAIEKAALEDPFLADAIEGIREMHPDLNTDLMELKTKLSEKTEQRSLKVNWLAILAAAAIIISISFGGWLFFRENDTPQIAKLEETAPTPAPSTETSQDTAASTAAITAPADEPASQAVPADESVATKKSAPAPAKIGVETPPSKEEKTASTSKVEGKAEVNSTAPATAPAKSEPTAAKKAMLRTSNTEAEKQLSLTAEDAAAPRAQSGPDLVLEMAKNVEPANGWSAFAKYVAANMKRPAGENAGLHGKVPMSFVVAPDGSISNIKVERSLHPEYDKEAIRLLTNGPKWKASNADKPVRAVYTIVF